MIKALLSLPFRLLASPLLFRWLVLPAAAVMALAHYAPPQFWVLFRLYAEIEVALALLALLGG